jgi:hypothetical protein
MILTTEEEHRLLFQYSGKKMAWITGTMGLWLLVAAGFLLWQNGLSYHAAAFILFGILLAAYAANSARAKRGLEIDRDRGSVRYAESALARKEIWEKAFTDFASISVNYPRKDGRRKRQTGRLVVEIVSREGGYYPVTRQRPGVSPEKNARELAERIGGMMNLPMVASIGRN